MSSVANEGAKVAACPFCGKEVDQHLILYGGSCPHCFGEIPGEEAPTDPGEERKKADLKLEAKKVQRSRLVPALLMFAIVSVIVLTTGYLVLKPKPVAVLNLDDAQYNMQDLVIAGPPVKPQVASNDKPGGKTPQVASNNPGTAEKPGSALLQNLPSGSLTNPGTGNVPNIVSNTPTGDGLPGLHTARPVDGTATVDGRMSDGKTSASAAGGIDFGNVGSVNVEYQQPKFTLTDDNAIVDMLMRNVNRQWPSLRSCYDDKLKEDGSFAGSWLLSFVVQTDGSVKNALATPKERQDGTMEKCLANKVAKWTFQPIAHPQEVNKTVRFKSTGG